MKNVFVKMATRMNWRVLVTVIGVAACVMYLNGTTSMVEGLDVGTEALAARVNQGPYLVFEGDSLASSAIDESALLQLESNVTSCWALEVSILAQYVFVDESYVVACEDPDNLLNMDLKNFTTENIRIGRNLKENILEHNLSASRGSLITLEYQGENETLSVYRASGVGMFSDDWAVVHPTIISNLTDDPPMELSFLLVPLENQGDINYLKSQGYHAVPTTGTVEFFDRGMSEVAGNLWGIIFSSAIVITILVFSLLGIEVRYREKDIKIMSQIGASPGLVMSVFLGQALFISLLGALLGVSMGIVSTNFISSWSSLFGFTSFITPQMTFNSVVVPIIVAMVFGLIGGIFPAYLASGARRTRRVPASS
ncbi:MAG: FtsX-like permease family protein [Thermoplasmata archaeon]|nr:FtsX-like permease family protein [Thermoplasmata archaeon]